MLPTVESLRNEFRGVEMNCVSVGLVSSDQFFREGLKALLEENGYKVTASVADQRELDAAMSPADTPVMVLIDLARDIDTAADQLRCLNSNLPGVGIVSFSDERDGDWLTICEDYEASALLRKQVSFKALLHCLELVMIGEKVMPTDMPRTTRERSGEAGHGAVQGQSAEPKGDVIPCMTCGQPFETEDRRTNRICSSCKSRMSRISSVSEHTLHY